MLIDTSKLPLPGADTEPGLKSWLAYLETIRPLVEGEYSARLTPSERQVAALHGGIEYPAMETVVPFAILTQKLQTAKVVAWEKEKAGYAAKKAAPSAMDSYKPVLVGSRTGVFGVFDFDTWT